jgi:hypothetical protein
MSTLLLDLNDRIVTDTGSVVAKYDLLIRKLMSGEPIDDTPVEDHPDVRTYAAMSGKQMIIWKDDGEAYGPPEQSYSWIIPKDYQNIDIGSMCADSLERLGLVSETYTDRLERELEIIQERQMEPFLKCLVYVVDKMWENYVVWGIGRGSSCASLVLYLLGVNRVDPVKYDIPLEEFYK